MLLLLETTDDGLIALQIRIQSTTQVVRHISILIFTSNRTLDLDLKLNLKNSRSSFPLLKVSI